MKWRLGILLLFLYNLSLAQKGYEIKVTLKPFKNQYIYLGHYYGRQLPIIDSVKLNNESQGIFKGSKPLGGGIYLIGYPDRSRNFEILIDKEQRFAIVADTDHMQNLAFPGSRDNTQFKEYQDYMSKNGKALEGLYKQRIGSTAADSLKISARIEALNAQIKAYRAGIITKAPNSFLTTLLKAMKEPEVPKNDPASKSDSMFSYHFFKKHYWDNIQFYDDRFVRTPFFESKIDKYFEQLVYPNADSVNKELDYMLGFASINEEMQRFLLLKFVNRYLNQRYMWEDAVFVHLFEVYFAQKNYPWLTDKGRKIISDRAYSLMANILGNPAPEISLPDSMGKTINLYGVEAPYVLVVIWDPNCSHCKETLPKIDSMFQARWKSTGMKIFGLAKETDAPRQEWIAFMKKNNLKDWINVYYSKAADEARINSGTPGYAQLYDVQSFPTLYLVDKDKRIIAKKITYEQVDEILQHRFKNQ